MPNQIGRYEELSDFVQNQLKMSQIYQPVMLMILLGISGTLKYEVLKQAMTSRLLCSFPRRSACSSRFRRSLQEMSSRTWENFNFRSPLSRVFLCLVRSDLSSLHILNLQHLQRHTGEAFRMAWSTAPCEQTTPKTVCFLTLRRSLLRSEPGLSNA